MNSTLFRIGAPLPLLLLSGFSCLGALPPATCQIAGTVLDSDSNQPLGAVQVFIAPVIERNGAISYLTAADGHFVFSDLAPGKYLLAARRPGYTQQLLDQHEGYSTAVACGSGLDTTHIRFPLQRAGSISGTVLDDNNEPVVAARVSLYKQSLFSGSKSIRFLEATTTNDLGHYRFAHLLPGVYSVGAGADPWFSSLEDHGELPVPEAGELEANAMFDEVYRPTFLGDCPDLSSAVRISLAAESQRADLTLHLQPSRHIRVKFQPDQANNTPGIEIRSVSDATNSADFGLSPKAVSSGIVEFSRIPTGEIVLLVQEAPTPLQPGFTHGFHLAANSLTDVDARPSPVGPLVSGTLKLEGLSNSQTQLVELRNHANGEYFLTDLSPSGEFTFAAHRIPPGSYELNVDNENGFRIDGLLASGAKVAGRIVQISDVPSVRLTANLVPASGTVTGIAEQGAKGRCP